MHLRRPRKAFVLAAGLGTRLRPLTQEIPKPMLPLWGRPMLERLLERLVEWKVREVLINLHHAPGPIVRYLATQPFPQLRISAVFEPEILGTGGALRNAAWFLDQPFWLLNADVVADLDPAPLLAAWRRDQPLAACWLTEDAGPKTVRCQDGLIRHFQDTRRGHATFCGLHLLDPRILRFVAPHGFDTIIAAYQRARKRGQRIAGVFVPGSFWADIGSPAQYLQAHRDTALRLGHAGESFVLPACVVLTDPERRRLGRWMHPANRQAHPASFHTPIPDDLPVEVLPPRGSAREFFHIQLPANQLNRIYQDNIVYKDSTVYKECIVYKDSTMPGRRRRSEERTDWGGDQGLPVLLIRWSPVRPDNRLYARHTRFLESLGVPVPRIFLDAPRSRLLLMEDLGAETLETRLPGLPPAERQRIYRELMDVTWRLHREGLAAARRQRLPLMPGFDSRLYAWERQYFIEHMVQGRLERPTREIDAIRAELETLEAILSASEQVLIHRDWQSSNVLFRGRHPVMIDYQGMRRGPAAYDLASLLCDPYADLPDAFQQTMLDRYCRRHPRGREIADAFPAAAIQRLCQALGAYAVLCLKPGMESFARHIPTAGRQMLRVLQGRGMPALESVAARLATTGGGRKGE